jgi:hypothetical protein
VGIPMAAEVMASRWASEAFMVTQFRDNPFEKLFYELDKTISESDYKRVYHIPKLKSHLSECYNNRSNWNNARNEQMQYSLGLLRSEIGYELQFVGEENFPDFNKLEVGKFDSTVYDHSIKFLSSLEQYYLLKQNKATREKDERINKLTNTSERLAAFEKLRESYQNGMVTAAVKNLNTPNRIVEFNGKLVQRIYPIYFDDHKPSHPLNFSANLFQPTKHFVGVHFDTYYFNMAVIWSMTAFLFVALYFDLLKKFIGLFEQRKHRRREKN